MTKAPRFRKDGLPDGRGYADASRNNRFSQGDNRPRPGRPKGARDEKSEVCEIRDMPVNATIGGKQRKVTTRKGILLRAREKALAGDRHAIAFLDNKFAQYEPPAVEPDLTRALLEVDLEVLAFARSRGTIASALGNANGPEDPGVTEIEAERDGEGR